MATSGRRKSASVTGSPKFEAHADLACGRDGRVWIAWDESGPNWGKDIGYQQLKARDFRDTSLWDGRTVRLACWQNGQLKHVRGDLGPALPPEWDTLTELPKLAVDSSGRLWLFFRRRMVRFVATRIGPKADAFKVVGRGGKWDVYASVYSGGSWGPLISSPDSSGRNDVRLSTFLAPDGALWAAWESDQRPFATFGPGGSAVFATRMDPGPGAAAARSPAARRTRGKPAVCRGGGQHRPRAPLRRHRRRQNLPHLSRRPATWDTRGRRRRRDR